METDVFNIDFFLEPFRGVKVDFLANNGNIGDMLIHKSTMTLFSKFNIEVNIVNYNQQLSKVLFVSGGGNLIDKYNYLLNRLKQLLRKYNEIIILPHTYYGKETALFLKSNEKKFKIICRELNSYFFLKQYKINSASLFVSRDLAFYMSLEAFKMKGKGELHAFREDIEKTGALLSHKNFDLSVQIKVDNAPFNLEFWNTDNWEEYLTNFIEIIASYSVVHTNRLHVAITAALLGKEVYLYPNSYYKNKGVYKFSLAKMLHVRMCTKIQQSIYVILTNIKNIISYR